jgi:2-oxoglutarate ferredoxin oxidoreductase subunit alpha
MFDFTIWAFNLSEQYRLPVIILADEVVGHMTERVVIPPADKIQVINRKKPSVPPGKYLPYLPDSDGVAPMATLGEGYHMHVTGLTHDQRGYPVMDDIAQEEMINRLVQKVRKNVDRIIRYDTFLLDDAEVAVVAYGISVRSAKRAAAEAREKGIKAGVVKLNTIWPFPEKMIRDLAKKVRALIMPEINYGQMVLELERCAGGFCPVRLVPHAGGAIIQPDRILTALKEAMKETA